jgi:putative membrane protein
MMHWWHAGWVGSDWLVTMLVTMLLILILGTLILAGIVALSQSFGRVEPARADSGDSAGEILARRFARGEIDGEEYLRRLEVLGLHSPMERASQVSTDSNREAEPAARC